MMAVSVGLAEPLKVERQFVTETGGEHYFILQT